MLEFVESSLFSKYVQSYLSDDELADMQWFLARHPEAGDLIPGSGGCRKLRWNCGASGKRGGVRTVYYSQTGDGRIWLLVIYRKADRENIPAHVILKIRSTLVTR